ncbi:glycosyltransferase family 2 protein [Edaphobacter albus]|uniref:glycosyltransferase family 2 protein n=1 Tax=Edaphobacter sp. 4G125 TaxID=2763071 RepID=UPI0016455BEF|nr:glycosyltransferase family 2 protein [Edaphobacter sp. 4G125]QNI36487.1 glycosyltransferase family 2 protein [Edaphobacter sp. 4G125]
MISVLILTKNEQRDLPGCLESVAWSDDVHVLDSYSTDDTVKIAEAAGAKVTQRAFDNYATHRNAGMTEVKFKYPWLFLLDADERPTAELSREMQQVVLGASENVTGFRLRRRDFLFGTWLKHAQISPFYIRLVRPERAKYTRAINEVIEVDGRVADLGYPLDHYPFSKGIAHWVAKHNTYSTMEAELIYRQQGLRNPSWKSALRDPDFHTRRLHQKALFYRMPARPLIKWAYMMFFRGAILDGGAGVTYATLQSFYEYMIVLKTRELERGGA